VEAGRLAMPSPRLQPRSCPRESARCAECIALGGGRDEQVDGINLTVPETLSEGGYRLVECMEKAIFAGVFFPEIH